jgi:hypothetical protein
MKNLILSIALIGCALGCQTDKSAAVSDPSSPSAPKAECCSEAKGECSAATKAECSGAAKAECSDKKASCPATKPQG